MYVPYSGFSYCGHSPKENVTETYDALYNYDSHSYDVDSPASHPISEYHPHSSVLTCDVDEDTPEITHDIPNFFLVSSQANL